MQRENSQEKRTCTPPRPFSVSAKNIRLNIYMVLVDPPPSCLDKELQQTNYPAIFVTYGEILTVKASVSCLIHKVLWVLETSI